MQCRSLRSWLDGPEMLNGASFAVSELRTTPLSSPHPATRLAGLVLALVTAVVVGPWGLAVLLPLIIAALAWTGLGFQRQAKALGPWLPVAVLVMVVHTLTTVAAAPLGHPSLAGVLAGVKALARVGCSVGLLGLYLRIASLDDLIAGTGWWLGPLQRWNVPVQDLGLMLAVALGTAPVVLGEARRIEMVVRLRRTGPNTTTGGTPRGLGRWFGRILDRAQLVVPLLETLGRRAEALTLSLRRRRPALDAGARRLPVTEVMLLAAWLVSLIWLG